MSDFPDDGQAGKPTTLRFADLTTSAAFQVCGKRGAFSHAHRDRHHVMTIVTSEEGEKIWNTFPPLNHAELCAWAESEDLSPPFRPMCCYLRPGDILIQPPGRLHAPLSLTDVLITGTMHLHPKTLVEAVQQSIVELHHPEVTNEEPAAEFSGKMSLIHASWMEKSGGYSWDTKERCNEFSRDLRVSRNLSHHLLSCAYLYNIGIHQATGRVWVKARMTRRSNVDHSERGSLGLATYIRGGKPCAYRYTSHLSYIRRLTLTFLSLHLVHLDLTTSSSVLSTPRYSTESSSAKDRDHVDIPRSLP
jgi:hypothetical protein